jgi:hypothetical protein
VDGWLVLLGHHGVTIEDGDLAGLDVSGFQTEVLPVDVDRNRVRDLFVEGGSHGIALVRSDGNRIERTAVGNTANDNLDHGIEAVPGVVDGGGNTASGNGNPTQCLNVACA